MATKIPKLRRETEGLSRVLRNTKGFNFNSKSRIDNRKVSSNVGVDKFTFYVGLSDKIGEESKDIK